MVEEGWRRRIEPGRHRDPKALTDPKQAPGPECHGRRFGLAPHRTRWLHKIMLVGRTELESATSAWERTTPQPRSLIEAFSIERSVP